MDQAANIHRVAQEMVRRRGRGAYAYLSESAQNARLSGDIESAITWWDIALAALEILKEPKPAVAAALSAGVYCAGFA
jgi:hypothetical protein